MAQDPLALQLYASTTVPWGATLLGEPREYREIDYGHSEASYKKRETVEVWYRSLTSVPPASYLEPFVPFPTSLREPRPAPLYPTQRSNRVLPPPELWNTLAYTKAKSLRITQMRDFCEYLLARRRPGPEASLSESEVLTLAISARWSRFNSERDFYRYADTKLRDAFPTLPDRSQFNRSVRSCTELIEAFALHLASLLTDPRKHPYQALDSSAMPIRDCKHSRPRRGLFLIRLLTRL